MLSPGGLLPTRDRVCQYTQFCRHYHAWAATIESVLRQVYVTGNRALVDYAGPTMPVIDRTTGESICISRPYLHDP